MKLNFDGFLNRYNPGSVDLENKHEYGIDYGKTFATISKMTFVCPIISIATLNGWSLHQMNVKNAFLHGNLIENIYRTPRQT